MAGAGVDIVKKSKTRLNELEVALDEGPDIRRNYRNYRNFHETSKQYHCVQDPIKLLQILLCFLQYPPLDLFSCDLPFC